MSIKLGILIVIIFAVFLVGAAALTACQSISTEAQRVRLHGGDGTELYRIYDREAGVVCWTYRAGWGSGEIKCLPCKDTTLGCERDE